MGQMPENRLEAYMPMGDLEKTRDFNFTDIRGFKVNNTTGHKVGTVKEVFVDPNTLEPCFAFIHYEKFMNWNMKHFLVPWHELILGEDSVQTRPAEPGFEPVHAGGEVYDPIEDEMEQPLGAGTHARV
jgi:hypothetical protein